MHLDELPREGESDAESAVRAMRRRLALREQIEHARQHVAGDTNPRITHDEADFSDLAPVCLGQCGRDPDLAPFVSEFHSVVKHI